MNKILVTITLLVLCVFTAGVFAQSATRTVVTLGGTWWGAAYSYENEDGEKIADIGSGNSFGPYISINHGKLNFGASLLWGTFPVDESFMDVDPDITQDHSMSRNDMNFSLGYRVHPNINVFLGGKYINWKIESTYEDVETWVYDDFWQEYDYVAFDEYKQEYSEAGMMYGVGIAGVLPLGSEGLYLFGSIAGMGGTMTAESTEEGDGTDYSVEDNETDIDATMVAINLGLGYRFPSGFGVNAGYRADLFTEDLPEVEDNYSIRVQGLIITGSYSF